MAPPATQQVTQSKNLAPSLGLTGKMHDAVFSHNHVKRLIGGL